MSASRWAAFVQGIAWNWRQELAFLLLSLLPLTTAAILELVDGDSSFRPYTGTVGPVSAVAIAAAVGAVSLGFLHRRGWFEIYGPRTLAGAGIAAAMASLLAVPVIAVDYGAGIEVVNVPWPASLLFYPAIGFVAEIVFHALPLALVLAVVAPLAKIDTNRLVWICIVFASLLEPAFQLSAGVADRALSWIDAYVWLQVWAVNLLQLVVFRRFGFASMYAFRLVYYLWWHILWGYLRVLS
jgi:NADH:ubiquinone oxidoreductase subunit K